MTASIKEREDKVRDSEDYVEDQEITEQQKKLIGTSLRKHWKERERKLIPREKDASGRSTDR